MPIFAKLIASAIIAASLFFTGVFVAKESVSTSPPSPSLGSSFTPAQIPQTYLSGAGVTSSATTIPLTSFATRDGRPVAMSMLGQIGYGTLEPGTSKEEIVSFTGITQNGNGTAVLTGVLRGLDFVYPYAASSTLAHSHAGNATFIISNSAPFYGQQFALLNNTSTFSSTTPPLYDGYGPNFGNFPTTTFASVSYVNLIASQAATNFWSVTGNNIYNNNTQNVGIATTTPTSKLSVQGTLQIYNTTGATSTIIGPLSLKGAGANGQPYLAMSSSLPPYGILPGDFIDAGYSSDVSNPNGYAAINTFNSFAGTCDTSDFIDNGNIPNNTSDYFDLEFTNTGYTGVGSGCLNVGLTNVKPETGLIYSATGDDDSVTGTTTANQGTFNWAGLNGAWQLMSLTNQGVFTVASTTATSTFSGNLQITKNATTTNLVVSSKCTNCADNGYATTTNTVAGPSGGGGQASQTALCAAGKKAIAGGGDDTTGSFQGAYIDEPNATASGWTFGVTCMNAGGCTAGTITTYAVCVNQ